MTSEQLGQLFWDSKTQSCPAILTGSASVGLCEGFEDFFLLVGGDTNARVFDIKTNMRLIVVVFQGKKPHVNVAPIRELDGVTDKINQALLQTIRISTDNCRQIAVLFDLKFQSLFYGPRAHHRFDPSHNALDRMFCHPHIQLAGFYLGEIQNVINQFQQVFAAIADSVDVVSLFVGKFLFGQDVTKAYDSVHGRTDLMAHICEKFALCLIGMNCFVGQLTHPGNQCFKSFIGDSQVRGPFLNCGFQFLPGVNQCRIALLDLVKHFVESVYQRAHFIVVVLSGPSGIAFLLRNSLGHFGQTQYWPGDDPLKS